MPTSDLPGASTSPRPFRNGDFVDGDPAYLAKTFSTIDQVLLTDWVAGGMQADRDTLVRRLREMVERAMCLPAVTARRRSAGR